MSKLIFDRHFLILFVLLNAGLLLPGCAFKGVQRSKGLVYLQASRGKEEQALNIFAPRSPRKAKEVLVYFYGGNWTSGKRSLYSFLGNRLARKGVVTVIVDYPKSPAAQYDEMAADAALSVKWVQEHIAAYGGDPEKIFVSGHSAGGHLAALISMDPRYFRELGIANPVKGAILIDAAGLDMHWYMKEVDYGPQGSYLNVFTKNPEVWKMASPIYHISPSNPPLLLLRGGRTYPTLASGTDRFVAALRKQGIEPRVILQPKKTHIPMITQFFNVYNPRYKDLLQFMKKEK